MTVHPSGLFSYEAMENIARDEVEVYYKCTLLRTMIQLPGMSFANAHCSPGARLSLITIDLRFKEMAGADDGGDVAFLAQAPCWQRD